MKIKHSGQFLAGVTLIAAGLSLTANTTQAETRIDLRSLLDDPAKGVERFVGAYRPNADASTARHSTIDQHIRTFVDTHAHDGLALRIRSILPNLRGSLPHQRRNR